MHAPAGPLNAIDLTGAHGEDSTPTPHAPSHQAMQHDAMQADGEGLADGDGSERQVCEGCGTCGPACVWGGMLLARMVLLTVAASCFSLPPPPYPPTPAACLLAETA